MLSDLPYIPLSGSHATKGIKRTVGRTYTLVQPLLRGRGTKASSSTSIPIAPLHNQYRSMEVATCLWHPPALSHSHWV